MGTDDLFRKRREERKKRQHEYRQPKANSFLIVTEGKCTEPFYFKRMILYQNIWIVFDKDDFADFDFAIKAGRDKGYKIA